MKKLLKKIFCLPVWTTLIIAVPSFALVIICLSSEKTLEIINYISYLLSAYSLVITIIAFPRIIRNIKYFFRNNAVTKAVIKIPFVNRIINDSYFSSEVSLYFGLLINLFYIIMKFSSGIYYRSLWLFALGFYYLLLAVMRFSVLHPIRRKTSGNQIIKELKSYRFCGIVLLLMNQSLALIVILIVHQNHSFSYNGLLIYGMAVYTFYSVISAVCNLVKTSKRKKPALSALKIISLTSALVSVLSLETAMLTTFGSDDDNSFRPMMTGITGGIICVIILGMAVYMIIKGNILLKKQSHSTNTIAP
ncbi:MAG: hypothetical protein NC177_06760 [Ruminococcus flavefaciens]|nr:hypothetical protein [Ruminococcus flavefaciens]